MSASSAGYLSAMAWVDKNPTTSAGGRAVVKSAVDSRSKGAIDSITAFIPSEALTLYIGGLAVVTGIPTFVNPHAALWTTLVVAAIANLLIGLQAFALGLRKAKPTVSTSAALGVGLTSGRFWIQAAVTEIAFVLYVMALPDSPILQLWHIDVGWAGLLVVLVAPIVGIVGNWVGLTPNPTTGDPA